MAAKPVVINAMVYRRDKSEEPYPATVAGFMWDPTLTVGGGPILPPGEVPPEIDNKPPEPPLTIWPPDEWVDVPEHPIVLPDPPVPPEQPPATPTPPHQGWNWSSAAGRWYFLYVPPAGAPAPKRPKR